MANDQSRVFIMTNPLNDLIWIEDVHGFLFGYMGSVEEARIWCKDNGFKVIGA